MYFSGEKTKGRVGVFIYRKMGIFKIVGRSAAKCAPNVEKAGLKKRQAYETRHTAQLLGHCCYLKCMPLISKMPQGKMEAHLSNYSRKNRIRQIK
jgi:hypothetical protein